MRSRHLAMGLQTLIGGRRDRLEFSREFNQTAASFVKIAALFFRKVPPFEKMVALNFPKVPLNFAKQLVLLTNRASIYDRLAMTGMKSYAIFQDGGCAF